MKTVKSDLDKFILKLNALGFDMFDCPYPSSLEKRDLENIPIVKAIRKTEKSTGISYSRIYSDYTNKSNTK